MTPSVSAKFSVRLHARSLDQNPYRLARTNRTGSAAIAGSVVEARLSPSVSFEGPRKYAQANHTTDLPEAAKVPTQRRPCPRRRKSRRNGESTQTKILNAATDEFARWGYGGARIERISHRAGTNDRSLYYYFGSKKGLFRVVLERVYLQIAQAEY